MAVTTVPPDPGRKMTATIQALADPAADYMIRAAKAGELR
jgi:hypothetical protein